MYDLNFRGLVNPEGVVWAMAGSTYVNLTNGYTYKKLTTGTTGWQQTFPAVAGAASVITQIAWDDADRADGAAGTAPSGQVWRAGLGEVAPVISGGKFVSPSGGAVSILLTDLPGTQDAGTISYHQIKTNTFGGDSWLFAAFVESPISGVVCQRGSDRVRVGTQVGQTITWAQTFLVGAPNAVERLTLKLDLSTATAAATVYLDGATVIIAVALPTITLGRACGFRIGSAATLDHWRALRQEAL